jgi:hypothetical protein
MFAIFAIFASWSILSILFVAVFHRVRILRDSMEPRRVMVRRPMVIRREIPAGSPETSGEWLLRRLAR